MIVVGLTGGIGSGKSTVARIFSVLEVPVFDADTEAKKLLDNDEKVRKDVVEIFGEQVLASDKGFDKKKIAALVFSRPELLNKLNAVVHPAVRANFRDWLNRHRDNPYVLKEAAVLFESEAYKEVDKIICVTAPEKLRIERVMQRDHVLEEEVEKRISNQWTEEEKTKRSDVVILNDGETALIPQVLAIHIKILNS